MLTRPQPTREGGFTLIELVVALAITFMVVFYTLATFTYQHQTYIAVEQVSETQQNSRAIASLIERDIRNAGYQVPSPAATCGADSNAASDVLYLSDADAIRQIDLVALDELPVGDIVHPQFVLRVLKGYDDFQIARVRRG